MFLTFGVMAVWPKRKSTETRKACWGFSLELRRPSRKHRGKKLNAWYHDHSEVPPSYDDAPAEDISGELPDPIASSELDYFDPYRAKRSGAPSPTSVADGGTAHKE
jgi:hypothetical protein